MTLLAIDPGTDTGWAVFVDSRLTSCGLGLPPVGPWDWDVVVAERPKLRTKATAESVVTLAINLGEHIGRLRALASIGRLVLVAPEQWKAQITKAAHHPRIWSRLDAAEQRIVDVAFASAPGRNGMAPSKRHNVLDAIGIGLYQTGRYVPRGAKVPS